MTEIQFLVDILMNFKLPEPVKQKFIARIGEVEALLYKGTKTYLPIASQNPSLVQAPSTQKLLDEILQDGRATVIQSPVAAEALAHRQQVIAQAGKPEPGRTSPRKF